MLNHRLGVGRQKRTQANPLTMKDWANLVRERIKVRLAFVSWFRTSSPLYLHFSIKEAHAQGRLDKIEGWREPMLISNDEKNPFVGREEFLI